MTDRHTVDDEIGDEEYGDGDADDGQGDQDAAQKILADASRLAASDVVLRHRLDRHGVQLLGALLSTRKLEMWSRLIGIQVRRA